MIAYSSTNRQRRYVRSEVDRVLLRLQTDGRALLFALPNEVAFALADHSAVVHALYLLHKVHGVAALSLAGRIAVAAATKCVFALRISHESTVMCFDIALFGLDKGPVVIVVHGDCVDSRLLRRFVDVISMR